MKNIFNATELRRFDHDNGSIQHIELRLDDSILMISDSTDNYAANTTMLHIYVPDVFNTYKLAIDNGCKPVEEPVNKKGDTDTRGGFRDLPETIGLSDNKQMKTANEKQAYQF